MKPCRLLCRAIEAAADGCSDVVGMAYWWSNCIQLRWMLWAMCHGGGVGDEAASGAEATGDEFGWVMQVSDRCFVGLVACPQATVLPSQQDAPMLWPQ